VTTPTLTSTRNPHVRAALELRTRRARDASGLTLVDGARELSRALDASASVRELFTLADPDPDAAVVIDRARAAGATVFAVDRRVLDHLGYGERHEGVVAVIQTPDVALAGLSLPADPLIVVLEGVEKPGNVGAVLRTADAVGAAGVIVADARTDIFNPNSVPVAAAAADAVRAWLREHGIRIVAARVEATLVWSDADLTGPLAIVLGSETHGLTSAWRDDALESVRLPMLGAADSLNVSITAAVLLYEAHRQRERSVAGSAASGVTA
jgi:TrmH family RNA methyltransferase